MSYILEALKRAEAERDRGTVPTLHSQTLPPPAGTRTRMPIANWVAVIALLALVVLGALWWTLGRQPAPVVLAPVTLPSAPAVVAVTPAVPAAPATPVAPTVVTPPRPAAVTPPRKTAEPPRAAAPRPAASAVAAAAPQAPAPAPRASAASTAPGLIYNVADLPDDIRAQLPKLAISGVTYSAQAAYRMLIVNGQVLHENDEPAPGLTLETIRQKDMVLRFKGYRYSVGY